MNKGSANLCIYNKSDDGDTRAKRSWSQQTPHVGPRLHGGATSAAAGSGGRVHVRTLSPASTKAAERWFMTCGATTRLPVSDV